MTYNLIMWFLSVVSFLPLLVKNELFMAWGRWGSGHAPYCPHESRSRILFSLRLDDLESLVADNARHRNMFVNSGRSLNLDCFALDTMCADQRLQAQHVAHYGVNVIQNRPVLIAIRKIHNGYVSASPLLSTAKREHRKNFHFLLPIHIQWDFNGESESWLIIEGYREAGRAGFGLKIGVAYFIHLSSNFQLGEGDKG